MRLLIATPLYPPDIAPLAVYTKELAKRLSASGTAVTIVAYGRLPETIPNVHIITVRKDRPVFVRLFTYTIALWKSIQDADMLMIENGASVELPAYIISFLTRTPIIFAVNDHTALKSATHRNTLRYIFCHIYARAKVVLHDHDMTLPCPDPQKSVALPLPRTRPEILPFAQYPDEAFQEYEDSWNVHTTKLDEHLKKHDHH